ncbi:hypothetical protein KW797_01575 [Candidatus Parcubacteria bacterium]|nr:hypothetical protein [Candidatus Parcubacteria bacterium]
MDTKYEWKGPEAPLGMAALTAVYMSITKLEDGGAVLQAEGIFIFRDHMEGCDGDHPWTATGTFADDRFEWVVRRPKPVPGDICWTDESGEPIFCCGEDGNAAIKAFIAGKLTYFVRRLRMDPAGNLTLVDEPERYRGVKHLYRGPCVCSELNLTQRPSGHPFDWKKHTNGGQYPKNCFECSCRKKWFLMACVEGHEPWIEVGDEEAWRLLTEFNGVETESLALDPETEKPSLVLLKTLRARGLIPIG